MPSFYALHESDPEKKKKGMFLIDPKDAKRLNEEEGYGIHWVVQDFKDGIRKLENLEKINYWIADIDEGEKAKTLRLIAQLPIAPTFVVETKRGFHCYWRVKGEATLENYEIIEKGIAEKLGADGSLISPTHALRCPNSLHLKDPKNPFRTRILPEYSRQEQEYSEAVMLRYFKPKPEKKFEFGNFNNQNVDLEKMIQPENWERILHTDRIKVGDRNNQLYKIAFRLRKSGADKGLILQVLDEINKKSEKPLDNHEIKSIVNSAVKN
jgi:hypothetical protein